MKTAGLVAALLIWALAAALLFVWMGGAAP